MNNLKIRLFKRTDEKDVYPILKDLDVKKFYRGLYCKDETEMQELFYKILNSSNLKTYTTILDRKKVGLVLVEYDEITNKIYLSCALNKKYRKKGVMEKSIKLVLQELEDYFDSEIYMYIMPQNVPARNLVEKLGAKQSKDDEYVLDVKELN